jgi:acyl-CoA thioester hydrolase
MSGFIETYRGVVFPWEVDQVGHLTVAYYFERLEDATLGLLDAIGLGADYMAREGRGCVTVDCYVRYQHELRVGDILHIESGVIAVDGEGVRLGHKLFNSDTGALCTTVEQDTRHVQLEGRRGVPLTLEQQAAAGDRRVEWDGPARERRPQPRGTEGFVDSARDTVKPWELDVFGQSAFPFYVHRFSAAGIQTFAAFGMSPAYQRGEGRGLSTFEFQLRFFGPLRAGDPVAVRTGLLHIGNSSIRLFHKMFNARTGELVATLDQFGVHLDVEARRPAPLPETLRQRAKAMLAPVEPV